MAVVVAEGTRKAMKKYDALMLRRIAWDAKPEDAEDEGPAEARCACLRLCALAMCMLWLQS